MVTGFKKMMVFFLFITSTTILFAQNNPRLGILPFSGGEDGEGETMALLFSSEPELARFFTVIPRISNLETITREPQFRRSTGLTDVDTIARLSRPHHVSYVMTGHIRSLGEDKLLLVTIIQVEKFRLIAGTYRTYQNIEELEAMIPDIIRQVAETTKKYAPLYTPRLAILPVIFPAEIDPDDTDLLTHVLALGLVNSGRFSVQLRAGAIQTIMTEQRIKHSVVAEPANVRTIGRALNVQNVLSGDIRFLGEDTLFIASILNTADASHRTGNVVSYQSPADGMELMEKLGSTLGSPSSTSLFLKAVRAEPSAEESTEEDLGDGDSVIVSPSAQSVRTRSAGMILVAGGSYRMGSRYSEVERPVHDVEIDSFYLGKNEVTQEEWMEIMESNPSYFKGPLLPVESISWYDAVEYCNKRSVKEGLVPAYQGSGDSIVCDFTASGYRLPTEAEWEYAARRGTNMDMELMYTGEQNVNNIGWFTMNSGEKSWPVMSKNPDYMGLYDMSGNVYEWCWDWYENYTGERQRNPAGPASGTFRIIRGGSWLSSENSLRLTGRSGEVPSIRSSYIGFRLARSSLGSAQR